MGIQAKWYEDRKEETIPEGKVSQRKCFGFCFEKPVGW